MVNSGTLVLNTEGYSLRGNAGTKFVNKGTFKKTEGSWTTTVEMPLENLGAIHAEVGKFEILHPVASRAQETLYGEGEGASTPNQPHPKCGEPVSCATGNFSETQTDFAIGGRGVGLDLTRTYNSQAAQKGNTARLATAGRVPSAITLWSIKPAKSRRSTRPKEARYRLPKKAADIQSARMDSGYPQRHGRRGYTLTLANQIKYKFAGSSGRLGKRHRPRRQRDDACLQRNRAAGNDHRPRRPEDQAGIQLRRLVESAEDPMKHVVKYTYEGGNLKSVTQPAEAACVGSSNTANRTS